MAGLVADFHQFTWTTKAILNPAYRLNVDTQ